MSAARASARSLQRAGNWFNDLARHQFITRNRRVAAGLTALAIAIAVLAVQVSDRWFSPGEMILPILCGGLLLWPRALRILIAVVAAGLIYDIVEDRAGFGIGRGIAENHRKKGRRLLRAERHEALHHECAGGRHLYRHGAHERRERRERHLGVYRGARIAGLVAWKAR